ncbi:MAG: amidohydrolase family protein, partial [Terrimesophilobacter sp.]
MTTLTNAHLGDAIVDVTLEGARISSIAPSGGALIGERIDLDGRWLLPGLWDHHVHANQQALAVRRIDLSGALSAAAAARTMADNLSRIRLAPGHPFIGHGFRDGLWPDVPTVEILDAAIPGVPTVIISGDLHACWLNTPGLAMFGRAGHPSGVFREDDCFEITGQLGQVPDSTLDEWVMESANSAASRGVVGVVDYEMTDNLASWPRRFAAGFDALHVQAGIYTEYLDAAVMAGRSTGDLIDGTHGLLTVGPFKIL